MKDIIKSAQEWFRQASYDLETGRALFASKRYLYCIFICHLALEKGLKGLFTKKFKEVPPKTHNLIFLLTRLELKPEPEIKEFINELNTVSIPTRYPDDLKSLLKEYKVAKVKEILQNTEEALQWLSRELERL